ncbi:hypothetical protein [Enterobacter kobei]|uniref:Uncharacterized protein n=2 Tax=Enterobacter kobei TaxID=208224 RepID=A0AA86IS18_9ENTR|nr:hypothetical protein [Enterobacter kobei]OLR21349.1 hypothetical protein BH713_12145 [Enterobacter kobei]BCU55285.1 hypothetical protein ENKO_18790 [Enterobacter kobei]SIQ90658.1 hypothetical protein SAMN05444841_102432 [Enterobacter kobei]
MGYIKSPVLLTYKARYVLYALFFRGALQSGDIPSKAGANELREAGLARTQHTGTSFGGEDYFTYLTPEGQHYAIQNLVETRFGEAKSHHPGKTMIANLQGMQEVIANRLDKIKELFEETSDLSVEGRKVVIVLLDRYVAISGKYTPEEISDAIERIRENRRASHG